MVPAVPTFPVDSGFVYAVPDGMPPVSVGSVVRVPLSGRRVRGYVVGPAVESPPRVKDVLSVSSSVPVFTEALLDSLRWVAGHYVTPLAAVLALSAPPNLARPAKARPLDPLPPLVGISKRVASAGGTAGRATAPHCLVGSGPWSEEIAGLAHGALAAGQSVIVSAPTAVEAETLAAELGRYGNRVLFVSSALTNAELTARWVRAATTAGTLVVGSREVALWPVANLALAIVVEEGRRAMKSPQSPTYHVRDVLVRRGRRERFGVVFCGPVPTAETLAYGAKIHQPDTRAWPLVEIVDWSTEPPGRGVLMDHTRQSIVATVKRDGRVLVFVPRRGYAPAFACNACGTLRRCRICGSGPDRAPECPRCGTELGPCVECGGGAFRPLGAGVGRVIDDLRRSIGDRVGGAAEARQVVVANERDLPGLGLFDLVVAVDADGLVLAPTYRAEENALRILARVMGMVRRGSGRRGLVQSALPGHRVMEALRRGRGVDLMRTIVAERRAGGFPPGGEVVALEALDPPKGADDELRELAGGVAQVLGPAAQGDRVRWLLQAGGLDDVKDQLRPLLQRWRDGGTKIRVDADPIDL